MSSEKRHSSYTGITAASTSPQVHALLEVPALISSMPRPTDPQASCICDRTQDMGGDPFGMLLRQRIVFLGGEVGHMLAYYCNRLNLGCDHRTAHAGQ